MKKCIIYDIKLFVEPKTYVEGGIKLACSFVIYVKGFKTISSFPKLIPASSFSSSPIFFIIGPVIKRLNRNSENMQNTVPKIITKTL